MELSSTYSIDSAVQGKVLFFIVSLTFHFSSESYSNRICTAENDQSHQCVDRIKLSDAWHDRDVYQLLFSNSPITYECGRNLGLEASSNNTIISHHIWQPVWCSFTPKGEKAIRSNLTYRSRCYKLTHSLEICKWIARKSYTWKTIEEKNGVDGSISQRLCLVIRNSKTFRMKEEKSIDIRNSQPKEKRETAFKAMVSVIKATFCY